MNDSSTDWSRIWYVLRKYILNKYIITLLVFGIVMLFVGNQSIINRVQRNAEIRQLERQRDAYNEAKEAAQSQIDALSDKDSLERFAREQYYMHTPDEEVYIVEDK